MIYPYLILPADTMIHEELSRKYHFENNWGASVIKLNSVMTIHPGYEIAELKYNEFDKSELIHESVEAGLTMEEIQKRLLNIKRRKNHLT